MASYGLVFPVQSGKESIVREIASQLKQRQAEYQESRAHFGCTVERVYLQKNPDGSALVVVHLEGSLSFADGMKALLASDRPIDRYFVEKNSEATGIDFRTAPMAEPELIAEWTAPNATGRSRGLAFAAPIRPGAADSTREFAKEAYQTRRQEYTESQVAKNVWHEEVHLNHTPMGDIVVVYLEGDDPVDGNRQFAESQTPYDRWFKDRCKEIFPPYVDFDQPVPANEEIFSWVASPATVGSR